MATTPTPRPTTTVDAPALTVIDPDAGTAIPVEAGDDPVPAIATLALAGATAIELQAEGRERATVHPQRNGRHRATIHDAQGPRDLGYHGTVREAHEAIRAGWAEAQDGANGEPHA